MSNRKVDSLIQFSKASRNIVFKESLPYEAEKGRIYLIIRAIDIAENSLHELSKIKNIKVISYENKDYLGIILGKASVAYFGIKNSNIAKEIINILNEKGGI